MSGTQRNQVRWSIAPLFLICRHILKSGLKRAIPALKNRMAYNRRKIIKKQQKDTREIRDGKIPPENIRSKDQPA
jgi:hypothetical protein